MDTDYKVNFNTWVKNAVINSQYGKECTQHSETKCNHKWKPTLLVFSTVFDCEHCNMKQEDDK